jgi:hypothetical protein
MRVWQCSREEGQKKKQTSSDNVAGVSRLHSREIKLKESKHEEGHIALGVK